jgi:peptidoglycan/LPS O-acetylase OafA/YrhL
MEISKFDKNRYFNSIDLTKFIMSLVVIAIHTHPIENCKNNNLLCAYDICVSLAVPFFFLAMGYLLAIKMDYPYGSENDLSRLKGKLIKIIQMYLMWTLFSFSNTSFFFKWNIIEKINLDLYTEISFYRRTV